MKVQSIKSALFCDISSTFVLSSTRKHVCWLMIYSEHEFILLFIHCAFHLLFFSAFFPYIFYYLLKFGLLSVLAFVQYIFFFLFNKIFFFLQFLVLWSFHKLLFCHLPSSASIPQRSFFVYFLDIHCSFHLIHGYTMLSSTHYVAHCLGDGHFSRLTVAGIKFWFKIFNFY